MSTKIPMETNHSQHMDMGPKTSKPTTPSVKSSPGKPTQSRNTPMPLGTGKIWNKTRPKKGVQGAGIKAESKIKNFAKLTAVKQPDYSGLKEHFAEGVPNTAEIRNGYTAPRKGSGKIRGGSTDTGSAGATPAAAHISYGAS